MIFLITGISNPLLVHNLIIAILVTPIVILVVIRIWTHKSLEMKRRPSLCGNKMKIWPDPSKYKHSFYTWFNYIQILNITLWKWNAWSNFRPDRIADGSVKDKKALDYLKVFSRIGLFKCLERYLTYMSNKKILAHIFHLFYKPFKYKADITVGMFVLFPLLIPSALMFSLTLFIHRTIYYQF